MENKITKTIINILLKLFAIVLALIPLVLLITLITIPLQEKYSNVLEMTRMFYLVGFGFMGLIFSMTWMTYLRDIIIALWEGF